MNWRDYAKYVQQSIDELARDCKVQVFRAKGPGGQGVNTTDSAVRMTHVPRASPWPREGRSRAGESFERGDRVCLGAELVYPG